MCAGTKQFQYLYMFTKEQLLRTLWLCCLVLHDFQGDIIKRNSEGSRAEMSSFERLLSLEPCQRNYTLASQGASEIA
jgi:hypothetical protein